MAGVSPRTVMRLRTFRAKPPLQRDVVHDVTVEQPVPRTLGHPGHRHGAAGLEQLRDDAAPVLAVER
jgi:hypothetical protein